MRKPLPAAARDSTWNTPVARPRVSARDAGQNYFQSSQELRAGLEISWQPLASLPAEWVAALTEATVLGSAPSRPEV